MDCRKYPLHPSGLRSFTRRELGEMSKEEFDSYEVVTQDLRLHLYTCKKVVKNGN